MPLAATVEPMERTREEAQTSGSLACATSGRDIEEKELSMPDSSKSPARKRPENMVASTGREN